MLNGKKLEYVNSFKYLGVELHKKLNWCPHVRDQLGKAERLLLSLSKIATLKWGLNSKSIDIIYEAVVLPVLSYAIAVWGGSLAHQKIRDMLLKFQRRICIKLIKGYRTISRESALVIANKTPLDLVLRERFDYYRIKISGTSPPGEEPLLFATQAPAERLPHPAYSHDNAIVAYDASRDLRIYTDGSKSPRGCGAAFAFLSGKNVVYQRKYKLNSDCNIVQAEVLAIRNALEYIISNKLNNVLLCSDSKAAIAFLAKPKISTVLNFEIYELFKTCVASYGTSACWLKAHNSCPGNDLADSLATSAFLNDSIDYDILPLAHAKALLRQRSNRLWEIRWNSDNKGDVTHRFFPTIKHRKNIKIEKHDQIITTFLSEHGKLNYYLHRFKIINSRNCNCGLSVPDTISHIIFDCGLFDRWRRKLISFLHSRAMAWPVPLSTLTVDNEIFELTKICFEQCAALYGPD
ncbi:uncharacterized protein [Centruroides vittatus]